MKSLKTRMILAVLATALLLAGCQDFFSSSLTPWAARATLPISADISTEDALTYLDQAISNNDPMLAASLTPILLGQAEAAALADPESDAYNELAGALVSSVLLSSNTGTAFNTAVSSLPDLLAGMDEGASEADLAAAETALNNMITALGTVDYSEGDIAALQLIADNPPEGISSDDLAAAAIGLMFQTLTDEGIDLTDTDNPPDLSSLEDNANFLLAAELLALIPEGEESELGFLLAFLPLE
ncbi:MAG: hypothetical protein KKI09_15895 [Spirochaetes bacterium]|nr:hypothetical protein [Spirochaetota bacterium]MBU0956905.1 hypothetical protein [Spirochaetota bacterium]